MIVAVVDGEGAVVATGGLVVVVVFGWAVVGVVDAVAGTVVAVVGGAVVVGRSSTSTSEVGGGAGTDTS